ncbi:glycosyltransferase family 2 protein [Domibacillus aminovorans]|uniref:Glycosyltransferase 2-like domain-containing protein n=1 Tax=Domibacillus aminovorans TaxID=29332 RepID=A0A177L6S0_9BACI|nr:cellulose synthase catalytic subunit [Domibacillus aminovorans]OAH61273.1 hypothetical protein AWH49_13885 [Domibacillus aminovorans]
MEVAMQVTNMNAKVILTILIVLLLFLLYLLACKWKKFKLFFILTAVLCNSAYILWRGLETIPMFSTLTIILGVVLFLSEFVDFFQSNVFRLTFLKEYKIQFKSMDLFRTSPTVDVFIATYNEPADVLKKTVAGCKSLKYPASKLSIYICDDGNREEIKLLAEEFDVGYITRESNEHAKAGNLNNAFNKTNGEFVMLLDADMIPKSYFLRRTMGYFTKKNVGFVQTPQVFYNSDPFQNNLRYFKEIPNEQDFFMRFVEAGRAAFNVVLHVGTNAVFRRSTVEDIGGFPTGSITEDLATGIIIQAKGYETVFVNEPLVFGMSVDTFGDLVKQRKRWARGNIQVMKKWGPTKLKGLNVPQRLIYFSGILYWFCGLQKLMFIIAPIIFLLTGIPFVSTNVYDLLLFAGPSLIASFLIFKLLSQNHRTMYWANIYEVSLAPYLAKAAFAEFFLKRQLDFNVTSKEKKTDSKYFHFTLALPHIILFILSISAIIFGLYKMYYDMYSYSSIIVNLIWCCYNISSIFVSILVCMERPKPDGEENITFTNSHVWLSNLSEKSHSTFNIYQMSINQIILYKNDYLVNDSYKLGDLVELSNPELSGVGGVIQDIYEKDNKLFFKIVFNELEKNEFIKVIQYVFENSRGYTMVDKELISKY